MGPHKCGFGIVNYNPRRTFCPLVPKQNTFSTTKVSPQTQRISNSLLLAEIFFALSIDGVFFNAQFDSNNNFILGHFYVDDNGSKIYCTMCSSTRVQIQVSPK